MNAARSDHAGEFPSALVTALARSRFAAQGESLTAWDVLEESERARHMDAARQVLQHILEAGYVISLPPGAVPEPGVTAPTALFDGESGLAACRDLAERFLRSGEPLLAYNAVQEGLEKWPTDLRLRQLQSLALARSGAVARANEGLQKLRQEGHVEAETLGLLARTHKDLAASAGDAEGRRVTSRPRA
jgi:adenylate cyclase